MSKHVFQKYILHWIVSRGLCCLWLTLPHSLQPGQSLFHVPHSDTSLICKQTRKFATQMQIFIPRPSVYAISGLCSQGRLWEACMHVPTLAFSLQKWHHYLSSDWGELYSWLTSKFKAHVFLLKNRFCSGKQNK